LRISFKFAILLSIRYLVNSILNLLNANFNYN